MSPRAAWRLEQYGFGDVYEYTGGKEDWLAAGLQLEGHQSGRPPLAELARAETPTCALGDRTGDVLGRLGGADFALVVGERQVVLGKLLRRHAEATPDLRAEEVMIEGPTTVRAGQDPAGLLERMHAAGSSSVIVTTKEGRLVGVVVADDLEAPVSDLHGHGNH